MEENVQTMRYDIVLRISATFHERNNVTKKHTDRNE